MILESITLENFRSAENEHIRFDPGVKMQARRLRRAEILQRDRLYIHASFMRSGSTM